jgi:hypothetical protein
VTVEFRQNTSTDLQNAISADNRCIMAVTCHCQQDMRDRSADGRRTAQQQKSRSLVDALEPWMRTKLGLNSQKRKLAEAIRYAFVARWDGLTLFHRRWRYRVRQQNRRTLRKNALFADLDGDLKDRPPSTG